MNKQDLKNKLDERGNRENERVFNSENAACQYLAQYFEAQQREFGKLNAPKSEKEILRMQKKHENICRN